MKKNYIDYADYAYDKQEEIAKNTDDKILKSVENSLKRKLSGKEKDRVLEDYSFWYDKYTSKKDSEFVKKEVSDISKNIKSKYFDY